MRRLGQHRGIIFDLDGTLVDSQLDFKLLCQQLGWPAGTAILEQLALLSDGAAQQQAEQIIRQFELAGARQARLMPGVSELLQQLQQARIPTAILTRNMREATHLCLEQLGLDIPLVLTREDAPAKPDPAGLFQIANQWQLPCTELLFIGDYLFDLQTAQNAGMPSCLYLTAHNKHFAPSADFVIADFTELTVALQQWL